MDIDEVGREQAILGGDGRPLDAVEAVTSFDRTFAAAAAASVANTNVAVISGGSSARYWHQASSRPRSPSVEMTCAICLSWRLPDMISSPMMIAPNCMDNL